MELLIDQRAPESLADTGHLRFFGGVVEFKASHLRLIIHNAYRMTHHWSNIRLCVFVRDLFGVGNTSARNTCRVLGLDPDTEMKDVQW